MRARSRDEYEKADGGSFILVDNVKDCVDLALSGVRAFSEEIQGWYASDGSHKYGTCLDRGGIVRTSGKSGYKQ